MANKREDRSRQGRGRAKHIGPEVGSRHRWRRKPHWGGVRRDTRGSDCSRVSKRGLWGADERAQTFHLKPDPSCSDFYYLFWLRKLLLNLLNLKTALEAIALSAWEP